ncbi:hypothetical protein GCM10007285_30150 [Stappia taiwanensis]|nr:hypothetical protein GCM10007285_30150 [Stappia taiwanensis]
MTLARVPARVLACVLAGLPVLGLAGGVAAWVMRAPLRFVLRGGTIPGEAVPANNRTAHISFKKILKERVIVLHYHYEGADRYMGPAWHETW